MSKEVLIYIVLLFVVFIFGGLGFAKAIKAKLRELNE